MFDVEAEKGFTTRAAVLELAKEVPDKLNGDRNFLLREGEKGTLTAPRLEVNPLRSKVVPITSVLWMRLSGKKPTPPVKEIQLKFQPWDSSPSYGHVEDRYVLVRDGEELPLVISHEYTEDGKMIFGERVRLMKPGDKKLEGVSASSQGPFGTDTLMVVESDGEIRAGTHFIPENIGVANIIDEEKRTLTKLTPEEQRFIDAQTRLLTLFGVQEADPFMSVGAAELQVDSLGHTADVAVDSGRIDLFLKGLNPRLVRNILRRTREGSVDQKAIENLLASKGSADAIIGLRLRDGIVNGEINSGDIGFITNIPMEKRILPGDIYPFIEEAVPVQHGDMGENITEVKDDPPPKDSKLFKPKTVDEYLNAREVVVKDEPHVKGASPQWNMAGKYGRSGRLRQKLD